MTTWDRHLRKTLMAKNRINLNPLNAAHVHSTQYRAGPRQRQLEKKETEQMLRVCVGKPGLDRVVTY